MFGFACKQRGYVEIKLTAINRKLRCGKRDVIHRILLIFLLAEREICTNVVPFKACVDIGFVRVGWHFPTHFDVASPRNLRVAVEQENFFAL